MRICPKCNRRFPDNTLFCPDDGKSLVHRVDEGSANGAPDFDSRQTLERPPNTGSAAQPLSQPLGGSRPSHATPGAAQTLMEAPPKPVRSDLAMQATMVAPPPKPKAPPFNPDNLVGQSLFGEYTINKKLGEGGMGAVYLAQQNAIDQRIAVKVLHAHAAESDELIQRFHREARVVSMLTHPNIIRVFIFGRAFGELLYLAMEYVDGLSLREELEKGQLDEIRAIKIMKQLCSGLSEAHDLGVVHRDLKPDNVLLTNFRGESNFVKILDFGIAKLKERDGEEQQKLTQAGIVYGTPEYLSPEQAQAHELDHRTDIYSLGVMLYEFMTGQVPFQAASPVQILTAHVFNEPKPPSQVAPQRVTPTMEKIILKAMAKDPSQRFQSALEMFEALVAREQEILRNRGLDGRATYVPGMELTGMYVAADIFGHGDGEEPTELMNGPTAEMIADARRHQSAQPPAPMAPAPMPTAATDLGASQDKTRSLIYALIGVMGVALIIMVSVIVFLVLR